MIAIEWSEGYRSKISARRAYQELERIRKRSGGEIDREIVKEAARPKTSVLHSSVFDCSKSVASERYYSTRARSLIQSIVVRVEENPESTETVRAFVEVRREKRASAKSPVGIFANVREALSEPEQRARVLAFALASLESWRRRYAELDELAEIFAAIDGRAA